MIPQKNEILKKHEQKNQSLVYLLLCPPAMLEDLSGREPAKFRTKILSKQNMTVAITSMFMTKTLSLYDGVRSSGSSVDYYFNKNSAHDTIYPTDNVSMWHLRSYEPNSKLPREARRVYLISPTGEKGGYSVQSSKLRHSSAQHMLVWVAVKITHRRWWISSRRA